MPDKIKVYELAKNLGVTSVFLMDKIRREWNLPVKSHMAVLTPDLVEKIKRKFQLSQPKGKSFESRKKIKKAPKKKEKSQKEKAVKGKQLLSKKKSVAVKPQRETTKKKDSVVPVKTQKKIIRRKKSDQAPLQLLSSEAEKQKERKHLLEASKDTENESSQEEHKTKEPVLGGLDRLLDATREAKKLPKKPGSDRTTHSKFQAADFRKREVIFQPKKKRLPSSNTAKKTKITVPKSHKRIVRVNGEMEVKDLAKLLGTKPWALLRKLKSEGVESKEESLLDFDTIALIVPEFEFEAKNIKKTESELLQALVSTESEDKKETTKTRPPVVTIMGHVDHGKTTLLDSIRKTRVASGEAGGITQHIGAYCATANGKSITFIDTPGHEAFTAMRSRGAKATDIVVIVVSAVDGVMPQTKEALNHAKAAKTPVIVAVNKMDMEGADPDKIKQQLSEQDIVPEEWGGDVAFVPLSALKGDGIKDLLERILLVAELQELTFCPERSAKGVVVEARLEKGQGSVVTFLIKDGTLQTGQNLLAGESIGRVKQIKNDQGEPVKSITAGFPAEVTGFETLPEAGDLFHTIKDEKAGRDLIELRKQERKNLTITDMESLSEEELLLKAHSPEDHNRELNVVLKADVSGSLEALKSSLNNLSGKNVSLQIIHSAVGGITESDVLLASTASGVVLGFHVRPDGKALRLAKEKSVNIQTGSVIYEILDQVKPLLLGLLKPEIVIEEKGQAEVREIFHISKIGTVAGCYVLSGTIQRGSFVRLVRDGRVVHEGNKLASLKRFKEDSKEVKSGFECGLSIEGFNDIKPKDVLETYIKKEVQQTEL